MGNNKNHAKTIPNFHTKILNELNSNILSFLNSKSKLKYVGPTQKHSQNNITISYNIYPSDEFLNQTYNKLHPILVKSFKSHSSNGELILYTGSKGEIIDQGQKAFEILEASHFELYLYEPESVIYCRLLIESNPLENKFWISLDFDIVIESAWFSDE